jgi:hypothetical protein
MNNCITCGVDLDRCGDVDLQNNKCGFCSKSRKKLKEVEINGTKFEIKSTLPLVLLLTAIGSSIVSVVFWSYSKETLPDYEYHYVWIMGIIFIQFIIWNMVVGSYMLKIKKEKIK